MVIIYYVLCTEMMQCGEKLYRRLLHIDVYILIILFCSTIIYYHFL